MGRTVPNMSRLLPRTSLAPLVTACPWQPLNLVVWQSNRPPSLLILVRVMLNGLCLLVAAIDVVLLAEGVFLPRVSLLPTLPPALTITHPSPASNILLRTCSAYIAR